MSKKMSRHLFQSQKGEIGTTLTVFAVLLMTIGVFIGSSLISTGTLNPTSTEAQTGGSITPNGSNPHITTSFGTITTRNSTTVQKKIETSICFKDDSGFPPANGRYKIEAFAVLKGGGNPINIGGALEQSIGSNRNQFICPTKKDTIVYTYANVDDIPGDVQYSQIDHIEFHLNTKAGNWNPTAPTSLIGTLSNLVPIFGEPPVSQTPTPEVCQQIRGKVPDTTIATAVASPASIAGWNTLENPSQPESATNRKKKFLTLKAISQPYHPLSNSLIFKAACEDPTGPQVCQQIRGKVPDETINAAMANPAGVPGYNELENPSQPESATNRKKLALSLKVIAQPYHPLSNSLAFKAACEDLPAQAGTITAKVKMDNTAFTGIFNGFEYRVETCTFSDSNNNGQYDPGQQEVLGCGTAQGNKQGSVHKVQNKVPGTAFTEETTDTFENMPGGKRVIRLTYGLYSNYGQDTERKETSGIKITSDGTNCTHIFDLGGQSGCLMTVNGAKTVNFTVKLPNVDNLSFKSGFVSDGGTPLTDCLFNTDSTADANRSSATCSGRFIKSGNKITIEYRNTSGTARKVKWDLTRCYGALADNQNVCNSNPGSDDPLDLKNHFVEAEGVQIPSASTRRCIIDLNNYPIDDETYDNVKAAVSCEIVEGASAATPTPTGSPSENEDQYYINISLYNSSSKKIVKITSRVCISSRNCADTDQDVDIATGEREVITIPLTNVTSRTQVFSLRVSATQEGETDGNALNKELSVSKPQSVYYNLDVSNTGIEGTAETEFDAADISGNKCVNAEDATRVITKLAEFTDPQQCLPEDINCDGIVNTLDLSVVISNLAACTTE